MDQLAAETHLHAAPGLHTSVVSCLDALTRRPETTEKKQIATKHLMQHSRLRMSTGTEWSSRLLSTRSHLANDKPTEGGGQLFLRGAGTRSFVVECL